MQEIGILINYYKLKILFKLRVGEGNHLGPSVWSRDLNNLETIETVYRFIFNFIII